MPPGRGSELTSLPAQMIPTHHDNGELELRAYWDLLVRHWRLVATTTLASLGIALVVAATSPDRYRATAQILMAPPAAEARVDGRSDGTLSRQVSSRRQINNQVDLFTSGLMHEAVGRDYDGPLDPREVSVTLDVSVFEGLVSDAATVSVTGTDPKEAARLVNIYNDTFIEVRRQERLDELRSSQAELEALRDELAQRITTLRAPLTAVEDQLAARPADAALLSLRDTLEEQLTGSLQPLEDQEALYARTVASLNVSIALVDVDEVVVLTKASVPDDPITPRPAQSALVAMIAGAFLGAGLVIVKDAVADRIVGSADVVASGTGLRCLATIPVLGSNRDTVVEREAASPGAETFRTLRTILRSTLLDRRGLVIQITSSMDGEGKTTVAANLAQAFDRAEQRAVVVRMDQPDQGPDSPGYLAAQRVAEAVTDLSNEFDVVIIDSTPVLTIADTAAVSRLADAVILVADARRTRLKTLQRALSRLELVGAPVVGVVITRAAGTDRGERAGHWRWPAARNDEALATSGGA